MVLDSSAAMGSNELQEKDVMGVLSHDLSNGSSSNLEAARRLAKRLYHLDRFKRSDVAKHLGKKYVPIYEAFSHLVLLAGSGGIHSWIITFAYLFV